MSHECIACPPGQAQGISGAHACTVCKPGSSQALEGMHSCMVCTAGQYASEQRAIECKDCDVGRISAGASTFCTGCAPGRSQPATGQQSCIACERGWFQPLFNATSCRRCPAGTHGESGRAETCSLQCAPAMFSAAGDAACSACPAGKFGNRTGAHECIACAANTFARFAGLKSCSLCAAGRTGGTGRTHACDEACAPGTYGPIPGFGCSECLPGQISNGSGSVQCTDCLEGQFAARRGMQICTPCPAGKFSRFISQKHCTPCPAGQSEHHTGARNCAACRIGRYQPNAGFARCSDCAAGQHANSTGATSCKRCAPGSFSRSGAHRCLNCSNGLIQASSGAKMCYECPPGRIAGNTGTSCLECAAGRYWHLGDVIASAPLPPPRRPPRLLQPPPPQVREGAAAPVSMAPGRNTPAGERKPQCSACPAGKYGDQVATDVCNDCGVGQFSQRAALTCTSCEEGKVGRAQSNVTCQELCKAGKYSERPSDSCKDCPFGKFQASEGQGYCTVCSGGHFSPLAFKEEAPALAVMAQSYLKLPVLEVSPENVTRRRLGFIWGRRRRRKFSSFDGIESSGPQDRLEWEELHPELSTNLKHVARLLWNVSLATATMSVWDNWHLKMRGKDLNDEFAGALTQFCSVCPAGLVTDGIAHRGASGGTLRGGRTPDGGLRRAGTCATMVSQAPAARRDACR